MGWFLFTFPIGRPLITGSYELLLIARGEVAAQDAVIVYLDDASYQNLGQPLNVPLDRALHARLIQRLTAAGARAIVFDIVFTDPNPDKAAADDQLAKAIAASRRVILAADNIEIGPKVKQIFPPFEPLLKAAAGVGSSEVIADPDLVVRKHTPEEQIPSLSWSAAELLNVKATKEESQRTAERWVNYYGPPNFLPWKRY